MKRVIFSGLFLLFAGSAMADPRDDALVMVQRCSAMGDKAQRLACYDSAAVRVPGALRAPPTAAMSAPAASPVIASAPVLASAAAGSAAGQGVPPPVRHTRRSAGFLDKLFGPDGPKRAPQTTVAEFGSESIANGGTHAYPQAMDQDTLDAISGRLVSYDLSSGFLVATLDNGQVWKQVAGDPLGHLTYAPPQYVATISRGGSGAYSMKLTRLGRSLLVRRLR
jgi:hypothetical protein